MKYMNVRKKYQSLELQLFADGDGGDGGSAGDNDDPDDDDDDDPDADDPDEKKFSQKDVDAAVKKRLEREKRKWKREQQKKTPGPDGRGKAGDSEGAGSELEEDAKARKAAEDKAAGLEMKVACFEAGVDKDAVDDVAALARSYMAADDELDLEDAIEKVVKKYPQFKKVVDTDDDDDKAQKSWAQRQSGRGAKKLSGVEARFYELNPDLKK